MGDKPCQTGAWWKKRTPSLPTSLAKRKLSFLQVRILFKTYSFNIFFPTDIPEAAQAKEVNPCIRCWQTLSPPGKACRPPRMNDNLAVSEPSQGLPHSKGLQQRRSENTSFSNMKQKFYYANKIMDLQRKIAEQVV